MKVLDVVGTGVKAAAKADAAVVAPPPRPKLSRDAEDELRRRAEVNAAAARRRAELDRALFGSSSRWLQRRPGWLDRRR